MTDDRRPATTTTDSGIPAAGDDHSLTVGPNGPTVLHDAHTVQRMQHLNRERVPERVVHAKGSGAFGFFEVTEDVTQWTSASFLSEVGRRTPMFAWWVEAAELGRYAYELHAEDDDFGQAGTLYHEVLSDTARDHLVTNIAAAALGHGASERRAA